jgi:hypothetical protein
MPDSEKNMSIFIHFAVPAYKIPKMTDLSSLEETDFGASWLQRLSFH